MDATNNLDLDNSSVSDVETYGKFEESGGCVYKAGSKKMNCVINVRGTSEANSGLVIEEVYGDNDKVLTILPLDKITNPVAIGQFLREVSRRPIMPSFGHLAEFFQYIYAKQESMKDGKTFKTTSYLGIQPDGTVVYNSETQIDSEGNVIDDEDQRYVLLPECLTLTEPQSLRVLQDPSPLLKLFQNIQIAYRHNTSCVLAAISGYMMLANYNNDIKEGRTCPAILLYSRDVDTGKTSTLDILTTLFGQQKRKKTSRISDAKFKYDAQTSTFPQITDDIMLDKTVENRIVNLFTGCGEKDASKKLAYELRSTLVVSSNFSLTDVDRVSTKVISIGYVGPSLSEGSTPQVLGAFAQMMGMADDASPFIRHLVANITAKFRNEKLEDRLSV